VFTRIGNVTRAAAAAAAQAFEEKRVRGNASENSEAERILHRAWARTLFACAKVVFARAALFSFAARRESYSTNSAAIAFAAEGIASKRLQGAIDNQEEMKMTRRGMSLVLTVLAALALALPIAARAGDANPTRIIVSMSVDLSSPATLGGTALKAGSYSVKADSAKVTLLRGGKVVAEAPVQWKDEAGKAEYSTIVTDNNQITEIHFSGKTKYVAIAR
jgi:hypothetical protein